MKQLFGFAFAMVVLAMGVAAQVPMPVPAPNGIRAFPPIWPVPQAFSNGTGIQLVEATNLQLYINAMNSTDLANAWSRFTLQTFQHKAVPIPIPTGGVAPIQFVSIVVANYDAELQLYVSENYTLSQGSGGINITADTVYGAYHALETLSQLIAFDFDLQNYFIRHSPWDIVDAPRFPHRGVLIDSSRHFEPIKTIKAVIDTLTMAKFNALHWHIVDAISFPYDSTTFPHLGKDSSYAPQQRFTPSDVADVVEYGRQRGIRVMAELDTPGHSGSMCYAYPDICPKPFCTSSNINNWALDITKNFTYEVVEGILTEFNTLFPEKMIHLGGDEVDTDCWSVHPEIVSWLTERGLTLEGGYEYYVHRVQEFVWNTFPSRQVVGWQEIWDHFGTALDKRTIIQQWLPDSIALPLNVTSHGYRLVWSDSSVWYLDHLSVTWEQMYLAEPCNGLPDKNCGLILGGEGCMWGETVDTSDILQTIWPRAAAIAERLWSPRENNSTIAAYDRMLGFRCLLNTRGVAAAPPNNGVARSAPQGPGSCYWQ